MIKEHHLIKLILIGSSGVGKTSILTQFADNKFSENYLTTIGVDFRFKTIKHNNKDIKFQIWDTAGQERFRTITSAYYKGAEGIIMVYDITDPHSLEDIQQFWIPEAFNYCDRNIPVLVLGNKSDCPSRIVPSKLQTILDKNNFQHDTVSAKNDEKIYQNIRDFGVKIITKKEQQVKPEVMSQQGSTSSGTSASKIDLTNRKQSDLKYKKNCC